eukprot:CAMPEP_0185031032 /NCGR_PEP_ID=MMETSP1103-20130426/18263_1 /TAXON_ID=36769 /ORGANISM="Paraphysomonas bandaiensis, Strain Caron Lab Isolate" /LENGTH=768 /DNA_ID=CAMNT_0027566387 /DNA_START=468 /DNA_END=2774 /DNA_ORIENTATION=-
MGSFLNITDPLIEMANMRSMAYTPILTPDQVESYETFAYNFYEEQGYGHLGINEFGKGIYSRNATTFEIYHDTEGSNEGKYKILCPVVQIGNLATNHRAVMFNIYSQIYRINAVDFMIDCFHAGGRGETCTSITDIIHLVQDPVFRPAVLIIHPVTPSNDKDNLVGFTYTVHNWDTILENAIPDYVSGMDAVLSTAIDDYTFRIDNGKVKFRGSRDLHDRKYTSQGREFHITYFGGSVDYSISLYPTDEFVNQFRTQAPLYACIIAVSIILITSAIFFLYDCLMNRQALRKELVINTKRLFVRFISHEIRTPMNTVHLGLKLLHDEMLDLVNSGVVPTGIGKHLTEWADLIQEIEESSDTAIVVLNDLINYDKISIGALAVENEVVDFWDMVSKSVKPFVVQAKQAGVTLNMDLEVSRSALAVSSERYESLILLAAYADPIKIAQAVRNVVSNAIKFTRKDGTVTVTAYWDESGLADYTQERAASDYAIQMPRAGSFVLIINDTGAGMSPEHTQHLFKEGVQFHANQLQAGGGSGLGLWISKGVVDLHHGTLTAHSDGVDKGSTFRLELPAFKSSEIVHKPESSLYNSIRTNSIVPVSDQMSLPLSSSQSMGASQSDSVTSAVKRILVVDDASSTRKVVCRLLKHSGYECYEAEDGQQCIDKMKEFEKKGSPVIDLVLMDFEMPRINGPTATQILRDADFSIPIIGVTGNVLQADVDFFLAHGATAVIHKPITVSVLQGMISQFSGKNNCSEIEVAANMTNDSNGVIL